MTLALASDQFSGLFGERRSGTRRFGELGDAATSVPLTRLLELAGALSPERLAAVAYPIGEPERNDASGRAHIAMRATGLWERRILDEAHRRIRAIAPDKGPSPDPCDAAIVLNRAALGIIAWRSLRRFEGRERARDALRLLVCDADELLSADIAGWL